MQKSYICTKALVELIAQRLKKTKTMLKLRFSLIFWQLNLCYKTHLFFVIFTGSFYMGQSDNIIVQKLDEFIRKYYKNQLVKGLLYSVGLVLLFYIGFSTLEYFAEFGTTVRTILFYGFIFTTGYVLTKYIVVPVLKLNSFGKVISHKQAAEIIGGHFTNVQDKLLNVLQLQSVKDNYASIELLNAGINQKIHELKPVPFTAAIDLNENRKYLKYVAIPILLLLVIYIVDRKILTTGTTRLIHHSSYFEKEAPFQFEIENKDLKTELR